MRHLCASVWKFQTHIPRDWQTRRATEGMAIWYGHSNLGSKSWRRIKIPSGHQRAVNWLLLEPVSVSTQRRNQWNSQMDQLTEGRSGFSNMECLTMQHLHTANAGGWGWTNAELKELEADMQFKAVYSWPDRKEEAHYAERSVGIMKVTVQAMMLECGLPHSWWRHCAEAVVFLLNGFPILSQLNTMPADGDQARSLERVTDGAYSRRRIDPELSCFLQPGTPVLVHDPKVKGSQLTPKSSRNHRGGWYAGCTENNSYCGLLSHTLYANRNRILHSNWRVV